MKNKNIKIREKQSNKHVRRSISNIIIQIIHPRDPSVD